MIKMARLDPLIKLRRQQVEEKQRFLASLYREQDTHQAHKDQYLMHLTREQALIETDPHNLEARTWYLTYMARVQDEIAKIDAVMAKLETRIMIARDEVRTAFAEFKKIEITDRVRRDRMRRDQDAREVRDLDDIALEGYRRTQEDG
jgi:flagellar biosynthesis chaperone FliJ